jgi:Mrp family chromosome partitioning ATPase
VRWPDLDYLIVDMDPSSGDSLRAITALMRNVGAFVITTSDVSSLADCRRMLDACEELHVKVLGVVGNMIGVECPTCGATMACASCGNHLEYGRLEPVLELAAAYHTKVEALLPWNPQFKFNPKATVAGHGHEAFDLLAKIVEAHYG